MAAGPLEDGDTLSSDKTNNHDEEKSLSEVPKEYIDSDKYYQDEIGTVAYIFPTSHQKSLTFEELNRCTNRQLQLGRNEIYARHGRMFHSENLQLEFSMRGWYKGSIPPEKFDESVLNVYEKENVRAIRNFEVQRSMVSSGNIYEYEYKESYDGVSTYQEENGAGDIIKLYMPDINTVYVIYQDNLNTNSDSKAEVTVKFEREGLSFVNESTSNKRRRIIFGETGLRLTQDDDNITDSYRDYRFFENLGTEHQGIKANWQEADAVRWEAFLMACGYCGYSSADLNTFVQYISSLNQDKEKNFDLTYLIRLMLEYDSPDGKGKFPHFEYGSGGWKLYDVSEMDRFTMDMFGIKMSNYQAEGFQLNVLGTKYELGVGDFGEEVPFAIIDGILEDGDKLLLKGRGGLTSLPDGMAESNIYGKFTLTLVYNPDGYQTKYRIEK